MTKVTIDLSKEEVDLIFRYRLLRVAAEATGALKAPEEYEEECINALQTFDKIQNKLREGLRSVHEPS